MQRKNVMLDTESWEAAQYLAGLSSHESASAAIRQAIKEQARRKGWKPAAEREFIERRRASTGQGREG
jgi:hypothetical protein